MANSTADPLVSHLRRCCLRVIGEQPGCGFVVAPRLLITCSHVVGRQKPVGATLEIREWGSVGDAVGAHHDEGREVSLQAEVLVNEALSDLALLRLLTGDHPYVALDGEVQLGDQLVAIGFTQEGQRLELDQFTAEFEGEVPFVVASHKGRSGMELKFKGAAVRHGFSGGPLLNRRTWRVIGVVTATRDWRFPIGGFAKPLACIEALLDAAGQTRPPLDPTWKDLEELQQLQLQKVFPPQPVKQTSKLNCKRVLLLHFTRFDGNIQRGRKHLILELDDHLCRNKSIYNDGGNRLVLLTGRGGIGKSFLAENYATEKFAKDPGSYREGIFSYQVKNSSNEGSKILSWLNDISNSQIDLVNELDIRDAISQRIASREMLIIFDNVTRSSASTSSTDCLSFKEILHALFPVYGSNIAVIITSQNRDLLASFGIRGKRIEVSPVDEDQALDILRDFSGLSFLNSIENHTARDIVRAVERLPLALRITGSALKSMKYRLESSDDLLCELTNYLGLLKKEKGLLRMLTLPESENDPNWSVEASLKMSLTYISEVDRDILIQFFSCFGACDVLGISRDLVMAISCHDEITATTFLSRLHTLSLIEWTSNKILVHPMIHAFAQKNLHADPVFHRLAEDRHGKFILKKITELDDIIDTSEHEMIQANFPKAAEWMKNKLLHLANRDYLGHSRHSAMRIFRRFLPRLLEYLWPRKFPSSYSEYIHIGIAINRYCEDKNNSQDAINVLGILLRIAEDMDDWISCISLRLQLSKFYSWQDDIHLAKDTIRCVPRLLNKILPSNTSRELKAKWRLRMSRLCLHEGNNDLALINLSACITLAKRIANKRILRNALTNRGELYWRQNHLAKACEDYKNRLAIVKDLGDFRETVYCLVSLDIIYQSLDKQDASQHALSELLNLCSDDLKKYRLASYYSNLGQKLHSRKSFYSFQLAFERSLWFDTACLMT